MCVKKINYLLSAIMICGGCLFGCSHDEGKFDRVNPNTQVQEQDQNQNNNQNNQGQNNNQNNQGQNNNQNNSNGGGHNSNNFNQNNEGNQVRPQQPQKDYQALVDDYNYFLSDLLQAMDDAYQIYGYYEWEVEMGYDQDLRSDYAFVDVDIYLDSDDGWTEDYIYDEDWFPMETLVEIMQDELEDYYDIDYDNYYINIDVYLDDVYFDSYWG